MNFKQVNLTFKRAHTHRTVTRRFVIHHSASPAKSTTIMNIQSWHLAKGWYGIGYHYIIYPNGDIYQGRPDWAVGAHAYQDAQHNANGDGIGICLIGDFTVEDPTEAQIDSLVALINYLNKLYGNKPVIGHKDVMPTQCPGPRFPWAKLKTELNGGDEVMSDVKIMVEGKILTGKILKDNLSYAPVRAVAEALGCKVTWDEVNRTVIIKK